MTPAQWRLTWDIFRKACELPAEAQRPYVESASSDPDVVREVLAMVDKGADSEAEEDADPKPAPSSRIGERVGRYETLSLLGRGGMGEVYSARDTELGRTVALKFLLPEALRGASAIRRLIREARAASLLNHPNIITVYEVIQTGDSVAIAMEQVAGQTLRDCQIAGVAPEQAIHLVHQIALALANAHQNGIVHRDIKPENIMVRPDGLVKVLDFGLAREFVGTDPVLSSVSVAGLAVGTVRYMAPEQLRGETATAASDVFSLGVVLYELLSGQHPFHSVSIWETAHAIASVEPCAPSELNPSVSPGLESLILRMLAKNASTRPKASEIAAILENVDIVRGRVSGRRWSRARRTKPRRWRWDWLAAAVLVLVAIGLLFRRAPVSDPSLQELTTNTTGNEVTAAAISPSGAEFVYADRTGGFVRTVTPGRPRPLRWPNALIANQLQWAADGSRILATGSSGPTRAPSVWEISLGDTPPRLILEDADAASLSMDGTMIAFTTKHASELWIARSDGRDPQLLVPAREGRTYSVPIWSANGHRLGYEVESSQTFEWIDASSNKVVGTMPDTIVDSATMIPDGRIVMLRWNSPAKYNINVWVQGTDRATGAMLGAPRQITRWRGAEKRGLTASSDGRRVLIVLRNSQPDVYVADLAKPGPRLTNIVRLTFDKTGDYPHAWTPDSEAVIFESSRSGNYDLYKQRLDELIPSAIVSTPTDEVLPQASPDGNWVLYMTSPRNGPRELFRVSMQGGNSEPVPIGGPLDEFRCSQAPGSRCVLRTTENGQFAFWDLDPVRGKGAELARVPRTSNVLGDWTLSMSGKQIAIPLHGSGEARFHVVDLNGGPTHPREMRIAGYGNLTALQYTADDQGWFATIRLDTTAQLLYVKREGRATLLREALINIFAVPSPDGRRIAFVDHTSEANAALLDISSSRNR